MRDVKADVNIVKQKEEIEVRKRGREIYKGINERRQA
jgi:hypothetical protein